MLCHGSRRLSVTKVSQSASASWAEGLERLILDSIGRRRTWRIRHIGHIPDLFEERRQFLVLQLQGDAHVRVLCPECPQFSENREHFRVDDRAATRSAVLV